MEEVRKYIYQQYIQKVDGLLAVIVSDRDGVPLVKATEDIVPDLALRPSFLSTFGMATDQAGKLGMGKNSKITCIYSNYQVVQMNKLPLLVTLIATREANTGVLMNMESDLDPIIKDLIAAVVES